MSVISSRMNCRFSGFWIPSPEPMGAASGMTAAAPASRSFLAMIRSSLVYGKTVNPSFTHRRVASSVASVSGNSVLASAMTSIFIRLPTPASRARSAVRTASSAVLQPAVLGRMV